jgi:hypothetical protein
MSYEDYELLFANPFATTMSSQAITQMMALYFISVSAFTFAHPLQFAVASFGPYCNQLVEPLSSDVNKIVCRFTSI